jgi:hypothetical protein
MSVLKLPKSEMTPEQVGAVEAYLGRDLRPVWDQGALVSFVALDGVLQEALKTTLRTGCLSQGLEAIAKVLDDEKKGLSAVQARTGQKPSERMSRLLLISNDGAERFYRQVASLLVAHGNRLWVVRVDVDSELLGQQFARGPAKAFLINDKKALAGFLLALTRRAESR